MPNSGHDCDFWSLFGLSFSVLFSWGYEGREGRMALGTRRAKVPSRVCLGSNSVQTPAVGNMFPTLGEYLRPALVLCPKLFRDDCREPHFWWPLQYSVAFMLRCYNLMPLGLRTQGGVWWPSAGICCPAILVFSTFHINPKMNLEKP